MNRISLEPNGDKAHRTLGGVAIGATLTGAMLCTACLYPAEERAEADLQVGRIEQGSLVIEVEAGLAAVRSASPERVHLWASAPGLRIDLTGLGARPFEVFVENCMPGSQLVAAPGATPPAIQLLDTTIATECRWSVESQTEDAELSVVSPWELADADQPFRFGVMSDVQRAIDEVQDIYQRMNAEPGLAFVLGAGDLTPQGTRDELERFQLELERLDLPYYTTLGNHELGVSPPLYHQYFGRGNFSFEFRGVRFTLLDSASATLDLSVYDWLDDWLDQGANGLHVVGMHVPPVDPIGVRNGSFASRNEAAKLLGRLASRGVDLTLYGHIHSYYRFENAGIPAHISGGGGALPETFDGVGRHFLVVEADPKQQTLQTRLVRVDP